MHFLSCGETENRCVEFLARAPLWGYSESVRRATWHLLLHDAGVSQVAVSAVLGHGGLGRQASTLLQLALPQLLPQLLHQPLSVLRTRDGIISSQGAFPATEPRGRTCSLCSVLRSAPCV